MVVALNRKRRLSSLFYNQSKLVGNQSVKSKNGFSVFILYHRESRKDRNLATRLAATLHERGIRTSPFYDGTNGFVLSAYEDKLQGADKVVAILSPDFLYSDESMFIFELARNMCMERGENNVIVCSRSSRSLPPAYNTFPRVTMTRKYWVDRLVTELKTPGQKRVNVEDVLLYKECEKNSSISMPSLSCHPPTLPKYMADSFMIWARKSNRPRSLKALERTASERLQRKPDDPSSSPVRKASSFNRDKETVEFVWRCGRISETTTGTGEESNSHTSDVDIDDRSTQTPTLKTHNRPISPCPPQDDPSIHPPCKKLNVACSVPIRKSCLRNYLKNKRRPNVTKAASLANATTGENRKHGGWNKHSLVMNKSNKVLDMSHTRVPSTPIFTNRPLPDDTGSPRHEVLSFVSFVCPGSVSDVSFFDAKKVHLSDENFFPPEIQPERERLNPNVRSRHHSRTSSTTQALSEAEFDFALKSKPEQFRIVTFDQVHRGFAVLRDEVIWLYTNDTLKEGNRKSMPARKRNGEEGRINKLLLRPYLNPDNI